jgi:hypothetical protein
MIKDLGLPVILIALLAAGSYWAGDHNRNNAWLAKQAVQERAARVALEAEVQRSNAAAARASADQAALQTSYSNLEGKFNALISRGPLMVVRNSAVRLAADSALPGAVPAAAPRPEPALAASAADVPDTGYGLSLGAVWVWNSALVGADSPAGACSAADPAAATCASDSGLGLADAWANHAINAHACATDRLRHQQLIDYLTTKTAP